MEKNKPGRKWRILSVVMVCLLAVTIAAIDYIVKTNTQGQLYSDVNQIPKKKVGLLLGTAKFMDKGRKLINPYYQTRIDAAVALYMAGKVDVIIVSGDNSTQYYNEPRIMHDDLLARGVPESHIYMDFSGFRTLDSILRCRDIFGQDSYTIISQRFHNQRALYIANHKKMQCVAFNANDGDKFWEVTVREKMARVKMMLDLFQNTQAKIYGDKVQIQ